MQHPFYNSPDDRHTLSSYPSVAIIVLNYNNYEDTVTCVRSLEKIFYPNYSITIIDNASTDGSGLEIKKKFPNYTILFSETNGGYASGNNIGIRYALEGKPDYILIINNDVTVEPDFLDHLVRCAEQFPTVGVFNAKIYYPGTNEIFSAAGRINKLLCTGQNKNLRAKSHHINQLKKVNYACGVLMLVRTEVFQTVGLLDEKYFMYFEDLEFSMRVVRKYEMLYVPQAIAYHKSGGGKGWKNYTELYLFYHTRNRFLVFNNSSWFYKIYVVIFTTFNCIGKTIFILQNVGHDRTKTNKQLKALWRGWKEGIALYTRKYAQ